jgi:diaminopimelate epimerase
MPLRFAKYHGLGNDFVVLEVPLVGEERARRICDRRRGIGADGVLTILPPRIPEAVARMHIYNSDGSVPEMCGNGLRCVARHLAERRPDLRRAHSFVVDTDAGPKTCEIVRGSGGEVESITIEAGPARIDGEQTFAVGDEVLRATRVVVGNPHAVLLDNPSVARAERIGPIIDKQVPGGVNVGFARPGPTGIDLVVWERGAGLTLACGTGACAAAVVAVSKGLAPAGKAVEVRLPGGALQITVDQGLSGVSMRGPAVRVCEGEAEL